MDADAFTVQWSQRAIRVLHELKSLRSADAIGRAVRSIDSKLRQDPMQVGEVYRVKGAIQEFHAIHKFIAFNFAVDTKRRLVLVRKCYGLAQP